MPAGKITQSSTILYTTITFIGLFIISTTIAIIFYIKAEDYRTKAATAQTQLEEMATNGELRQIGALVGAKQSRKSRLATMLDYLDQAVSLTLGGLPEDTSAEVKIDTINRKATDILEIAGSKYLSTEANDSNAIGLIGVIEKLNSSLDDLTGKELALRERLGNLKNKFDDAITTGQENEQKLIAEKEAYHQQVKDIEKNYNDLKALLEQTSEQQVQNLMSQLDQQRVDSKDLKDQLLKTQAELAMAKDRIKFTQEKLQTLVPPPDAEIAAFKPDGQIILIDDRSKIVHLNIGADDRVYRGLTFSVYDKNLPIPKDGKGKAEIEVFNVEKNISSAKIVRSEIKNPIVLEDVAANLIWDSDRKNIFVIAGDFDLNGDGTIDYQADEKVKALIDKWGGKSQDKVSVDTDFIILGQAPTVLRKPTFEELEVDPLATQKYEDSVQRLANYNQVLNQAKELNIPVFNLERFLYFTGYKTQSQRPGAF